MAVMYRVGAADWYMHAVGESASGRTVADNLDEWQAFLRRTSLVDIQSRRSEPPKKVNIRVPEDTGPKNTVGFNTKSGGKQEVKLPAEASPGDVVEVPLIDMYTVN